jgi:hypothetical protein
LSSNYGYRTRISVKGFNNKYALFNWYWRHVHKKERQRFGSVHEILIVLLYNKIKKHFISKRFRFTIKINVCVNFGSPCITWCVENIRTRTLTFKKITYFLIVGPDKLPF